MKGASSSSSPPTCCCTAIFSVGCFGYASHVVCLKEFKIVFPRDMSLLVSLRMQMNSMFDISSDLVKKQKKKNCVDGDDDVVRIGKAPPTIGRGGRLPAMVCRRAQQHTTVLSSHFRAFSSSSSGSGCLRVEQQRSTGCHFYPLQQIRLDLEREEMERER